MTKLYLYKASEHNYTALSQLQHLLVNADNIEVGEYLE